MIPMPDIIKRIIAPMASTVFNACVCTDDAPSESVIRITDSNHGVKCNN